jgi:hypothetical protein
MTEEEGNKYVDEWFKMSNEMAEIKGVTAQFFAWHLALLKFFDKIWQNGYNEGLKEGQKQKTSIVIKKLTKEN